MRNILDRRLFLSTAGALLLCGGEASAQLIKTARKVEAESGKSYTVTRKNGPWMIMVTSLRGDTAESAAAAKKAAHDLVMELRKKGIPAWIHDQKGELEEVSSYDRQGNPVKKFVAAQRNRVCVLAGEYASIDLDDPDKTKAQHAKVARDTLEWIQKFKPKALEDGNYRPTPGRPGPLSRAFLTLNPLFTEEEIAQMAFDKDPLLKQLNKGQDFNLLQNKGKFTLVVATFQGSSKHVLATGEKNEKTATFKFDSMLERNVSLDKAGESAWTLCQLMRKQGHEAYVFHERFRSIVTVGSFNDANDSRIPAMVQKYSAKLKPDPKTRQDMLMPEIWQVDSNPPQIFLLDLKPQLMKVPKLR